MGAVTEFPPARVWVATRALAKLVPGRLATMPNVFENYEEEYLSSSRTAAQNIEKLPDLLPGHEKDSLTTKGKFRTLTKG